jgi:hypothetical protein
MEADIDKGQLRLQRLCERVAQIAARGGTWLMMDEQHRRKMKVEKAVVRELHHLLVPE